MSHRAVARGKMVVVRGGTVDDTLLDRAYRPLQDAKRPPWVVLPEGVEVHRTQP